MAVRHEFGGEKQSNEASEGRGLQNPPSPKVTNPDNIDTLVSRFLDELSDISTGIAEVGNDSTTIPLRLPEEAIPAADSELEKIDEEIERSLAELESLRSAPVVLAPSPVPEEKVKPAAPVELPSIEAKIETATRAVRIDSEEQTWNRMELFKREIAASKRRRQMIGWILSGAGVIVILGVAGYFFFNSDRNAPQGVVQTHNAEPAKPAQTPGDIQQPAIAEKSTYTAATPQSGRPADAAKPAVQETRAKPTSISDRNATTGNKSTPGTSAAGQKPTRQGQNGNGASPTVKQNVNEEPPRSAAPQTASPTTAPPEPPSSAVNPPVAATQPKPSPAASSGTASNGSANVPAAPATTSTPEPPSTAPKGAPAVDTEAVNSASPPKARNVVMSEPISKVPPVYPAFARSQKISGKVEVDVEVNEKGDVVRAKAVSGPDLLRSSAEQALMKWKFKPASIEGVNVPSKARILVNYNVQ